MNYQSLSFIIPDEYEVWVSDQCMVNTAAAGYWLLEPGNNAISSEYEDDEFIGDGTSGGLKLADLHKYGDKW